MRTDEALLDRVARSGGAFLRLYRWDPPTLSLGRNQRLIPERGIPVVRRPTGGKAVWHEHELTYAVVAPIEVFGSLREAYCAIHTRLARALMSLGTDVSLAPYGRAARPSDGPMSCFAAPVGGEILVGNRKVVGSAQVRRAGGFLQHGSILLAGKQPGGGRETTLTASFGRRVTFDEVAQAIIATWGEPLVRPEIASLAAR